MALTFKRFLVENRVDFVKKQHGEKGFDYSHDNGHLEELQAAHPQAFSHTGEMSDKPEHKTALAHATVDKLSNEGDPSRKKIYTQYLAGQYKKGNFRMEDLPRVKEDLEGFERYKPRLEKKDINQYEHIGDISTAVAPHLGSAASKGEEEREVKLEGADKIYDDKKGLSVLKLKTREAACFYGKGTRWCTAADNHNYFDHYNKQGPLYIVNTPDKQKYQFHNESGQFMDPQDRQINLRGLIHQNPGLREVPDFKAWKRPEFDSPEEFKAKARAGEMYNDRSGRQSPVSLDSQAPHVLDQGDLHHMIRNLPGSTIAQHRPEIHPMVSGDDLHHMATNPGAGGFRSAIANHKNIKPETVDAIIHGKVNTEATGGR
eukprot:gnl/Spiro4/3789_TR1867_c0_g1_i1.p1 gnl/Spiro4/3789_TR1867_c0_g1~~gnl/Spiro4/3789_TR1867_c0_g1_i1.p1  ORF type:complete len:373 (-),score=56.50 gnl/Spiro4/3789_TR1867_c0_g1_i1:334-1452(-)